jgi:hypothetical protein
MVIDRWQMVSLFETQRTSTVPAAKICNATKEEKQPLATWLARVVNVHGVSMTILVSPTASPVTCWQIGGTKKEKETPHTRLFPSRF